MNRHLLLLPALCLLLIPGCSLEQRLARTSDKIEREYAEAKDWHELPLRTISWKQAISMLRRNNQELLKMRSDIEEAERQELSVYTDLIPGASYYGYMTRSLNELTSTYNSDSITSNVNITFSIPGLTQTPFRHYAAKARAFAAVKAEEGKRRELESKLYQAVRTRELNLRKSRIETENPDKKDIITEESERKDSDIQYWQSVCRLLGDPDARWEILPETIPAIRWQDYYDKLDMLDPLVVCNFAMRVEQARLAQYGIALRYLPTINTNLYSPSLFSSSGGTYSGTFLSGEDTRLNLGVSYMLDTKLDTWNSYQKNKEAYERTRREVSADLREHKHKVGQLRRSMKEFNSWKSFMHKRIEHTEKTVPDSAEGYIARAKELYDMRRELLTQEIKAIESEAALLLEYGLPE